MKQVIMRNNPGSMYPRERNKLEFLLMVVLFRLLIDYTYKKVISTLYAYMGFQKNENVWYMVMSWILLLLGSMVIYQTYNNVTGKLSHEILFLLFFMSFVPFSSMIGYGALDAGFCLANIIYWMFLVWLITQNKFRIKGYSDTGIVINGKHLIGDSQLMVLSVIFGVVVLYISGRYAHFRINFNLLDVYDFRAESKANTLPTILLYLFTWSRSVNTVLIAYFIRRKKVLWSVFCVLIQILSFGYDGSKSTLFLLIIAIVINLLPSFSMDTLNKWLLRGVVISIAFCAFVYRFTGNYLPISMIVRRVFYLPVRISKDYFAFFSTNTPDYFRQSFLRYFGFKSDYSLSIPNMMGGLLFNSTGTSANNGLISDAMANLGYSGIIIFPILIAIVLKILDRRSKQLDSRIYATVALYIALSLTNSFLFTILMTHGLIVTILILGMMKRNDEIKSNNKNGYN